MTLTAPAPAPVARHAAPKAQRRALRPVRFVGHLLLAVAAVAALLGAGTVVVQKLGFAPVLSPSMVPTFAPGDLLITKPQPAQDIEVGDVVVLPLPDSPGQRYVHRVVTVGRDAAGLPTVTTKGDANAAVDPWTLTVTSEKVPTVVTSVPSLGKLALHTNGAALRIPLLLLVAGGVLLAIKRALLDRY